MPPHPDTQSVTPESCGILCITTEMPYVRLFYLSEAECVCLLEIRRQCVNVEGSHSQHFKLLVNVNILSVKFNELISSVKWLWRQLIYHSVWDFILSRLRKFWFAVFWNMTPYGLVLTRPVQLTIVFRSQLRHYQEAGKLKGMSGFSMIWTVNTVNSRDE